MHNGDADTPGIMELVRKLARTSLGALQNRGELFLVELQEEKHRVIELLIWVAACSFLAMMFVATLTATIILLVPADKRLWAAGGFCVLYLVGALLTLWNLKSLMRKTPLPFADTVQEVRKDREWLESLK